MSARLAAGVGCLVLLMAMAIGPAAALVPGPLPAGFERGRVLVLRPGRIDVALDGRVRRWVPTSSRIDLANLPRVIGDSQYVSNPRPGVVRLSATIAQRPGSVLTASGNRTKLLELDGSGRAPVRLVGTDAALRLQGTSIAVTPNRAPQIGFLKYSNGSTVQLTGSQLTGLGDPRGATPAVEVTSRSTASIRTVRLAGGGPGVHLSGVATADLDRVSVQQAGGVGVRVSLSGTVRITNLALDRNAADGLRIVGPISSLTVAGVTASGNRGTGVDVEGVHGGFLTGLRTDHHPNEGVAVRISSGTRLRDLVSTWDQRALSVSRLSDGRIGDVLAIGSGVSVRAGSRVRMESVRVRHATGEALAVGGTDLTLDAGEVADSTGEGLVVSAGSRAVTVNGGSFHATRGAVRIGESATGTLLTGVVGSAPDGVAVQVSGSKTRIQAGIWSGAVGLKVRDRASDVVMDGAVVSSRGHAVEVPADDVGSVLVRGTRLTGGSDKTVLSAARTLTLDSTVVSGSDLGVDLRGDGSLVDSTVTARRQALRVIGPHTVTVRRGTLSAAQLGTEGSPEARVTVLDSRVEADRVSRGQVVFMGDNDLSPMPLRFLAVAAVAVVAAAVGLEAVRRVREAGDPRLDAPAHVRNTR